MIVYRIQVLTDSDWSNEWCALQADAIQRFRQLVRDTGMRSDIHVDKFDVPSGRDALAEMLTYADEHRESLPGDEVVKSHIADRDAGEEAAFLLS